MTRRLLIVAGVLALLACAAWHLYDPPWVASVTSGLRDWEEDPPGTRFRWTAGRASFFVPSAATEMTVPIRAVFPSPNATAVTVTMRVDDRFLADIAIADVNAWTRTSVPLPRRGTWRSYRRVELRVNRTAGPYNLGVQLGEISLRQP
jgi:hypothetical protein